MKKKIVIIDDEPSILEILSYNLKKEGYQVDTFEDSTMAISHIKKHSADLILTDWCMPGMDGLDVCRAIKQSSETSGIPIFMLTCKNDEIDVVTALELGADDFLSKPFRLKELIVRIKKTLKRETQQPEFEKHIIIRDKLKIDGQSYTVYINNEKLSLTNCEFKILQLLASKPGRVYSRQEIIDLINNNEEEVVVTLRSVDVQIVGLRKKLGEYKNYVETIRSVGYKFIPTL